MDSLIVKDDIKIENLIYEIRGKQVMLDSDLAKLYGCKNGTKDVNKAVKRNIDRFPEDFCFRLTKDEYENLIFQNGISKYDGRTFNKGFPIVYTKEGVAMLSVIKNKIATTINIKIMRAFVMMKRYIKVNSK